MESNQEMWQRLGLNTANHDGLLAVLGRLYTDIFLAQKERPQSMQYFNQVMSEVHSARIRELVQLREKGGIVVGAYCTYVPEEVVVAVGGAVVGLCAGADCATEEAERYLPRTTCALIKSTLGFKLAGVCPYIEVCSLIVGENTCDGKKKAYEQFPTLLKKPFHIIDLPNRKDEKAEGIMLAEYQKFVHVIEQASSKKLTAEALHRGVKIVAAKRAALQRLDKLRAKFDPPPISGLDALLINQVAFLDDPERFTRSVNALCDELEKRGAQGISAFPRGTPRILVSGCPMTVPNWKVPHIVESCGAVIVGEESCVGARGSQGEVAVDEKADLAATMTAIVKRYLNINCAIFSPNTARLDHIRQLVRDTKANGVLLYGLHFCTPYLSESLPIEKQLEGEKVPVVRIDTDYSQEDVAQLKTRIEAFVERIKQ